MSETRESNAASEVRKVMARWVVVLVIAGLFALWAAWRMGTAASRLPDQFTAAAPGVQEAEIEHWTCTMHPEVQESGPGDCPYCGMDLVPKYAGSDEPGVPPPAQRQDAAPAAEPSVWYMCTMAECNDAGSSEPGTRCPVCGMVREPITLDAADEDLADFEITLSERARRLADLATEPVERRLLSRVIRTVGKVTYDETRRKMVSAWTGGRIDKLFADYTGMMVYRGDHLVEIYSPELLSAQEEFLQTYRAFEAAGEGNIARRGTEQLLASSRRKLELLGITDQQIRELQEKGTARTHLVIHAPLGGTIVRKEATEGMYVSTGDVLYEIADLTHVWLLLDVYEADLPWIQPFQEVRVTAQSLPGEAFKGYIVFVDPFVDRMTRTIKVRVNVENPDRRFKPEMFVNAEIRVAMGADARAVAPRAFDPFACPMHPWESAAALEDCPICGMDMVPTETIPGYAKPGEPAKLLSVPREAVMQTGKRALVYVESRPAVYYGAEVQLGPLAHDDAGRQYYPILAGLTEGQRVVTRGNFVIDSQMQIAGKPSLFRARGLGAPPGHEHHAPDAVHDHDPHPAHDVDTARQTNCPVMGGPIDPDVSIEYQGVKVYFCCPGCDQRFIDDPEAYLPNLPEAVRERIRAGGEEGDREVDEGRPEAASPGEADAVQINCPVMGGRIDRDVYVEYRGVKVYFCCPGCDERFLNDPEKYLPNLPEGVRRRIEAGEPRAGDSAPTSRQPEEVHDHD